MIEIREDDSRLIGSTQAIQELSQKESARIIVLSDSHGNTEIFRNIILQYGKDCDAVIFCGDGSSDLAHILEDAESSAELKAALPPVIAYVQGNCDSSSFVMLPGKSRGERMPLSQVLWACGKGIYICHGHYEGVNFTREPLAMRADTEECQIAVYGHTHLPDSSVDEKYGTRIFNPGSCTNPRGAFPPSFMILTIMPDVIDAAFIRISDPYSRSPAFKVFTPLL